MSWDSVQLGGRVFFNPMESAAYQQRLMMRQDVLCGQALMPVAQPSMEQVMGLMGFYNGCIGNIQQLRSGNSFPDMSMMIMQNPQMMMFYMMYQQMQMQNMMLMMMIMQNTQLAMLQALNQTGYQNPSGQQGRYSDPGGKVPPYDGNVNISPSGSYGGTKGPIEELTRIAGSGFQVSSAKRDHMSTASGGVSDHYSGKTDAYAHDLTWNSSRPTAESDAAASRIVASLGGPPNWGSQGGNFRTTINGIRYQVIYKSMVGGNHYNHIHVGAHRV